MSDEKIVMLLASGVVFLMSFVVFEVKRNWHVPVITDKVMFDQMRLNKMRKFAEYVGKQIV